MHNLVNQSNDKKIFSKDEAFKLINEEDIKERSKCNQLINNQTVQDDSSQSIFKNVIYLFIILIIIFIIYCKFGSNIPLNNLKKYTDK